MNVIFTVTAVGLAATAALCFLGHFHQNRPAALDKKLPGFEGFTGDVAAFKNGLNAHFFDPAEDVPGPPYVGVAAVVQHGAHR